MSDPIIGRTNFIRRPTTSLLTKPGQKVHLNFSRTARTYNVSAGWNMYDRSYCGCSSSGGSSTWLGIGMLIGAVGGLLAKIFGGKKKTQQVVDNSGKQFIPKDNTPKQTVDNNKKNDVVDDGKKPDDDKKPDDNKKVEDNNKGNGGGSAKKVGNSPAGWYRATSDGKEAVSGLTVADLKKSETQDKKCAARYVLDQLLKTKFTGKAELNENQKAKLLNEIIKKNPSVFDGMGRLKEGTDVLSKLDVPSKAWIEKNIKGIDVKSTGANGINQVKVAKEVNQKTIRGDNGFYAVITTDPNTKKKTAKFYPPSENAMILSADKKTRIKAGNRSLSPESFAKICPNIYKQVMAELKKNP